MVSKTLSQLKKEIEEIEKKAKEGAKKRELEEKLERLKTKSKIGVQVRIRRGLGKGIPSALDRAGERFWG